MSKTQMCIACNGKGFAWASNELLIGNDGQIKASIRKMGERCNCCGGSGVEPEINYMGYLVWALIGAIAGYLLIFGS